MHNQIKIYFTIISFFCVSTSVASSAPFTFECTFPISVSKPIGDFSKNDLKISTKQDFKYNILVNGKEAFVIGDLGTEKLLLIQNEIGGYSFIEITPVKTLQITVVDKKLNAVHSRNTQLPDENGNFLLFPSQNYGSCKIK